jgi:hypothetical protein
MGDSGVGFSGEVVKITGNMSSKIHPSFVPI